MDESIISQMKYSEIKSLIYGGMQTDYLMKNGTNTIRVIKGLKRVWAVIISAVLVMYMGNKILGDGINRIPDYKYRDSIYQSASN